jgi:hypothetical protein
MSLWDWPRSELVVGVSLLALSLATPGLSASLAAPPAAKELRIDRFEWQAEPELSGAVRRIVVRNDYGDVRARAAGDGRVFVHAVMQRLGSGPDIGVNVERHGDALAVTVVAPPGRQAVAEERPAKTAVDRADMVVYVPEGASLRAVTLRGIVEARRLKGAVDVETLDGEVRLEVAGAVRARTAGGSVTVVLGGSATAPSVIETATGAVWLSLAEGSDYRLLVEPGGKVTSQVPLKEEETAPRRRLTAAGGAGLTAVFVRTEKGDVEIVQRRP